MRRARGGKSGGRGRFSRRGGGFGTSVNLLEVVGILKGLSKEDRGRCMRSAEIDDELSSMSGRNSGGGAANFNFSLVGSEEISKVFLKREDACKGRRSFLWNFKIRSREGAGQAAAGSAAAFAEPEYQVGMHAAAVLVDGEDLGGAETADSYFLNSLYGEYAAIFPRGPGTGFCRD